MKIIMASLLVLSFLAVANLGASFNENEWIYHDGRINPQKWKISSSGTDYWVETNADRNALVAKLTAKGESPTFVGVTQDVDDVAISTTVPFNSFQEFRGCLTSKPDIQQKVFDLSETANSFKYIQTEFPTFNPAAIQNRLDNLKHQIELLLRQFKALP